MSKLNPVQIAGLHSLTFYNINTGKPYGMAKVVGSANLSSSQELIENTGGSNPYPWAVARGKITTELSLKLKEYPDFLVSLLNGQEVKNNEAESGAYISSLADTFGSLSSNIASINIKDSAKVKSSKYIIEAVSATTINIYSLLNDGSFNYIDESLKINDEPLTILLDQPLEIAEHGIEITGNQTINMSTGDTAEFITRAKNLGSKEAVIGSKSANFNDFGLIIVGQKTNSRIVALDVFRVAGGGMPFNFAESAFSELEVTLKPMYDSAKDGVFKYINIQEFIES